MFVVSVSKTQITILEKERLTSNAREYYYVHALFDETWNGFTKTIIFRSSGKPVKKLLDDNNTVKIPWEILTVDGVECEISIVGTAGDIVLPTEWTSLGLIYEGGSNDASEPIAPTPSVYDDILAKANEAVSIAQSVRKEADDGKFNGKDGLDYVLTNEDKQDIADIVANQIINPLEAIIDESGVLA